MKKVCWPLAYICLAISLVIISTNKGAYASACYVWTAFPAEAFMLDIKSHGELVSKELARKTGHSRQRVYSVHGKHNNVCGPGTTATVTGTLIVSDPGKGSGPKGARMGLMVHVIRGEDCFCRPVELDCTSTEATHEPEVWYCFSRNEHDVCHGFSKLIKVSREDEPACSEFEEGLPEQPLQGQSLQEQPEAGIASGLPQK